MSRCIEVPCDNVFLTTEAWEIFVQNPILFNNFLCETAGLFLLRILTIKEDIQPVEISQICKSATYGRKYV